MERCKGRPFTGKDEYEQRKARLRNQRIQREKGAFYDISKLKIPCIEVSGEQDNKYRIKWFDSGEGKPRRRGVNETAFILEPGQAGVLKYNYRYTYYSGQWYKCYYVYVVNEAVLTQDIFIRDYDFEYNQLAELF